MEFDTWNLVLGRLLNYIIRSGDRARKSTASYGDANRDNDIFEANEEVIKDPDLIYPGQ